MAIFTCTFWVWITVFKVSLILIFLFIIYLIWRIKFQFVVELVFNYQNLNKMTIWYVRFPNCLFWIPLLPEFVWLECKLTRVDSEMAHKPHLTFDSFVMRSYLTVKLHRLLSHSPQIKRGGAVVESTCWSSRGAGFNSQHSYISSQPPHSYFSSLAPISAAADTTCMCDTGIHVGKIHTHKK